MLGCIGASVAHAAAITKPPSQPESRAFRLNRAASAYSRRGHRHFPADAIREVGTSAVTVVPDPTIAAETAFAGSAIRAVAAAIRIPIVTG